MKRFQIDPDMTPLLDIEIQTIFAFYNEFGFEEEFVNYIKEKGFEWNGFIPQKRRISND